jgi:AraC-like DNA-binding protein
MNYKILPIPPVLKSYIHSIWILEDDNAISIPKTFRTIADGKPGLIFQHSDRGQFYQNEKALPSFFLFGAATKHATIALNGQFKTIGVFFHPASLKTVFGLDASELTNNCIDADLVAKKCRFTETLLNSSSTHHQIELLTNFIRKQIQRNNQSDNKELLYILSQISATKEPVSLTTLANSIHLSPRSLQRRFKEFVGLSPQLFARISRFQQTIAQLQSNRYKNLTDIAFDNSFADQSHFIRTFKKFSGLTPKDYLQCAGEVA